VIKRQEAGLTEINLRIKARFDEWSRLEEKRKALRVRLERLQSRLARDCASAADPESVKHCAMIGWDTASAATMNAAGIENRLRELCSRKETWSSEFCGGR
jgi:predicted nuclease with TOPRIM domain